MRNFIVSLVLILVGCVTGCASGGDGESCSPYCQGQTPYGCLDGLPIAAATCPDDTQCTGGVCIPLQLDVSSDDTKCTDDSCASPQADTSADTSAEDPCTDNPCQNGGNCTGVDDSFTCECAAGFAGDTCGDVVAVCSIDNGGCIAPAHHGYSPIAAEYMVSSAELPGESNYELIAQTFTLNGDMIVMSVTLQLYSCKSNGLVDAQLHIVETAATGEPVLDATVATSNVASNEEIADSCVGGDVFENVTFVFEDVTLSVSKTYALHLVAVPADNKPGGLNWRRSSTPTDPSDPYSGGQAWMGHPEFEIIDWMSNKSLDLDFDITGEAALICVDETNGVTCQCPQNPDVEC